MRVFWGIAWLAIGAMTQAADTSGRTFMRYPTLHGNTIVFVAHDNLWSVSRAGGTAIRLNADDGRDVMPRFSPDGRWIAFTGEYQGNRDVYVMPAAGGPVKRLTFNSDIVDEAPVRWGPNNMVVTWTPDSNNIVFLSRRGYITVPEDALYGLDSQWVIENHGVDPDMPVDDSPADWMQGRDVQLQAAVDYIIGEMRKHPALLPAPPVPLPAYAPKNR